MSAVQTTLTRLLRCALAAGLLWQALSGAALGATCTSAATGNWNVGATWAAGCGAGGPVAGDTVNVGTTAAHTVTIPAGVAAAAASVTIGNTGVNGAKALTLAAASSTLTVSGAVAVNHAANNNPGRLNIGPGTATMASLALTAGNVNRLGELAISTGTATVTGNITFVGTAANAQITFSGNGTLRIGGVFGNGGTFTAGTGTAEYNGGGAQTVNNTYSYNNLAINKGGGSTATLGGNTTVGGNLTVTAGTLALSTFTANRTAAGGTISVANGATLNIGGTNTFPTNYIIHTLGATSTVNYSGTGQAVTAETYGHLTLSGSASKTPAAGTTTIAGNFALDAGVTYAGTTNNPVVNLAGNFSDSGTFNSGAGTFTFNGGAAQTLSGTTANTTFTNLGLNNTAAIATRTLTLAAGHDATVSGALTFTSGRIVTTATSKVIIPSGATVSGAAGSPNDRFVAGRMQKFVAAGAPTVTFEVGTDGAATPARGYTPASLTFAGVGAGGGSLIISVGTPLGEHPNIGSSGLDSAKSVNRWWSLTTTGVSGTALPAFTGFSETFTFIAGVTPAGDLDSGASTANFEIERRSGGAWNTTTAGTRSGTTTQATGITALGEFAIAEKVVVIPTPGSFNAFETSTVAGAITGVIRTKVAGTAFSLDVVAIAAGVQQNAFTGQQVTVELLGNNTLGVALDANNCPTSSTMLQTVSPNPTITTGRSTVNFAAVANSWRDVRVRVRYPTSAPTVTSCSTDNFAIRPASFAAAITDNDWQTAGTGRTLTNTGASGGNVHKAGQNFTITVTPAPGTATNYSGDPTVSTLACTLPSPCANGTLAVGTYAGSGTRVSSTATYSEAGAFNLTLVDQNYASVDSADGTPADCTATGRYVCQSAAPLAVGRFVPDRFALTAVTPPVLRTFCSFTYIGQPFGYQTLPVATISAQTAAGGTTTNYRGALWKLTNASASQSLANSPVETLDVTQILAPSVTETPDSGTGTFTANLGDTLAFVRNNAAPRAPFNANLSLTWSVSDAAEAGANQGTITTTTALVFNGGGSGIAFDSGNALRYGRLAVRNANGSQLVPLALQVEAQYAAYINPPANTVLGFVTNTADSCTSMANANLAMSSFTSNLSACETAVSGAGALSAGRRIVLLAAPGNGNDGTVLLTMNLGAASSGTTCTTVGGGTVSATGANRSFLQGNWTGANYDQNPSARASFGTFRGADEVIFVRENF